MIPRFMVARNRIDVTQLLERLMQVTADDVRGPQWLPISMRGDVTNRIFRISSGVSVGRSFNANAPCLWGNVRLPSLTWERK
jgi:hypothetical protein